MLGQHDSAIEYLRQGGREQSRLSEADRTSGGHASLTGKTAEARETLRRYLALPGTKSRTIAQWRALSWADNPGYLALREKLYAGLRGAGMPEE
jgi:hypothetical protein